MLTGEEIRRARQRAGWSQAELAERIGATYRTVGNWERGKTRPDQKETVLRSALSGYWDADVRQVVPLTSASDIELLGEIARRLGRSQAIDSREKVMERGNSPSNKQAAGSAAIEDAEDELDERRRAREPHRPRRPGHDPEWDMLYTDQRAATEGDPVMSKDEISDDTT